MAAGGYTRFEVIVIFYFAMIKDKFYILGYLPGETWKKIRNGMMGMIF